ncbi:MAG: ThiF family adenylyltransferase, partial [Abditibacteriota bacterium]|nr:ThiF family adenylyltransferase [Abditibacteriota bacterium]
MGDPRFSRIELMLGEEAAERLRSSFVVVVGLGAVGSYAVEGLARSGVGRIRLVDFDEVGVTNINRQLYALESTVGRYKCDVAAERVRDINP